MGNKAHTYIVYVCESYRRQLEQVENELSNRVLF